MKKKTYKGRRRKKEGHMKRAFPSLWEIMEIFEGKDWQERPD